jgi:predicted RNase H-like HicB family nuclease
VSSAAVIRRIRLAGWRLVRRKGSHHHFSHPERPGIVHRSSPAKGDTNRNSQKHRATVRRRAPLKKAMHYSSYISREGRHLLASFPDCPGCQTFADSPDALGIAASEALEGWLEAHLSGGQVPPRPVERNGAPSGMALARVNVRPGLAAALLIRWARDDAGLSQKALGALAGVSQQQIAKLEKPGRKSHTGHVREGWPSTRDGCHGGFSGARGHQGAGQASSRPIERSLSQVGVKRRYLEPITAR